MIDRIAVVSFALVVLLGTACGSTVEEPPGGGTAATSGTGGVGQGGQATTSTTMDGMCDGDPCCTQQAPPSACCMSACCPSDCGSGGSGGGTLCGGKAGIQCSPTEYCDFPNDLCGGADDTGTCKPRPQGCPDNYDPACGCDGKVYGNSCSANQSGIDVSNHGCPAPRGMFGCGSTFCDTASYCVRSVSDVGSQPDAYSCKPLPAACQGAPPSCDCLKNEVCGSICEATSDGGLELTCPGG